MFPANSKPDIEKRPAAFRYSQKGKMRMINGMTSRTFDHLVRKQDTHGNQICEVILTDYSYETTVWKPQEWL